MDIIRRVERYRFATRDHSDDAARRQMFNDYTLPRIGPHPSMYRQASDLQVQECMEHIFLSTEWCKNYLNKRHSVVTAWSSRILDIHERITDMKGIYKNRPISEAICVMLVASDVHAGVFLPVALDHVLENLNLSYRILENVSLEMKWAIHLTQINVVLVTPRTRSKLVGMVCNSQCMAFEESVSRKFTSAFYDSGAIQLRSTMVDMTNQMVRDRHIRMQVEDHVGIDSYSMQLVRVMC